MADAKIIASRLEPELWLNGLDTTEEVEYFQDGRDGVDRWGRQRKHLTACGTGFGEGQYVCPAYLEESCPGDRNPGDRLAPLRVYSCDLACGACGGGERTDSMAYCGWRKGQPMFNTAIAEMGGSLRLDRDCYHCQPGRPITWPVSYVPAVEWYVKQMMGTLTERHGAQWPMIAVSLKTAYPSSRRAGGQPLVERVGGYTGPIMVHGLTKDDLLDDRWDDRHRVIAWCREQGVDTMVTPQFSYYEEDQNCMAVYNINRQFAWYVECREAGFAHVALDWPPGAIGWMRDEYLDFVHRNEVKILAPSFQTLREREGLSPQFLRDLQVLHDELPADVAIVAFGLGGLLGMLQLARVMPGRQVAFANTQAYFNAVQFRLHTGGLAPPGWSKADAFAYNVTELTKITDRVTGRAQPENVAPRRRRHRRRR